MAAPTETSVANRALQKLGQPHIDDIDEDSPNARELRRAFEPVRLATLRAHAWNFAIKRASVAADGTKTVWGELNRYKLPPDYVRLLRDTEQPGEVELRKDWQIEGNFIISSDGSPLQFRYIADVDIGLADDLFAEALAAMLAYETSEKIVGSNTKKDHLKDDFNTQVAKAKRLNSYENDADEPPEDEWLQARR